MNHLLKMNDLTREELYHILDVAVELKAARRPAAPRLCWRARASR